MGRKLIIILLSIFFIILYGIYYWGIPAIINVPARIDFIKQIVREDSGLNVDFVNPKLKMGVLPSVKFCTDRFIILNDDNSKALDVANLKLNIKLLPLLFKKLDITEISSDFANVNLVYDNDLKIKLGQYDLLPLLESDFVINHAWANFKNYHVNFLDKLKNKQMDLDGKYFVVNNYKENEYINFKTDSTLKTGQKTSLIKLDAELKLPIDNVSKNQISIDGYVKNLDLSDFSPYAKYLSKDAIKSISGVINLDLKTVSESKKQKQINAELNIKDFGIFADNKESTLYAKDNLHISADVKTGKNELIIDKFKIIGSGIEALLSGNISKLNNKLPHLNLKVALNRSKAENILALLPGLHDLIPDIDLFVLKQAGFWGDASANLEIKGKADYPEVYGNVLVDNAYMVRQIPNAKKATIKLIFKGDKFDLDVEVPTSPTQTVWVKGPIDIDEKQACDLKITSTDNVDLKTAQIVLNPLHQVLHFDLGPVPIMDIKGQGGIDLRVTGTREKPHAWGEFWFKNAIVSFLDIHNIELHNGSGSLKFDDQNTYFETKTATLNGKPISVKGTCTLLGVLNFDTKSDKQDLGELLKAVKTSPMLADIQELVKPLDAASGPANIKLNLYGQVQDVNDIIFGKNIFAKGTLNLLSNSIKIKDVPTSLNKITGVLNFENLDANFKLKSFLGNSEIYTEGKIDKDSCNVKFGSNRFILGDALKVVSNKIPYAKDLSTVNTSFNGKYNGKLDNPEFDKVALKGIIHSNKGAKSAVLVNDSSYELSNSNFKLQNLKGSFRGSPFNISLNAGKVFSNNPVLSGVGKISKFDLSVLSDRNLYHYFPKDAREQLKNINFENGKIDVSFRAKNNKYNVYSVLDDVSFLYRPNDINIVVNSGNMLLHDGILNVNKINARVGEMPVFIDGKVINVTQNPVLNLYVNAKLTQDFFEQIFNKNSIYPIKVKGDAILSSKLNGTLNNINSKTTMDISENSSLYYMGATIGDKENPVKIHLDSTYTPNNLKINNLKYDKIILSQNNKPYVNNQLNASGTLSAMKDNVVGFHNFRVKTTNPTDAKIFNLIFRKPFMKQGVFSSDIVINGTSLNPKIIGVLDVTSIDIPLFDSTIRDINLNFKKDKIYLSSKGKVLTNDVILNAIMQNNLTPPYVINDLKLHLADLDINKITDAIRDIEAESARTLTVSKQGSSIENVDVTQLIINNAEIKADKIIVRNINADNFVANMKLGNNHVADIKNFKFDIAQGNVLGNLKYNLISKHTDINVSLNDANASIMSEAMFDLKGQVFGSIDGNFALSCNGISSDACFKTLFGNGKFKIANGKMPKLGSLEYLLKAGNLLKSGFTGISVNSLIDLVTPLKTGEFESISGDINIKNGIADNINIYSKGNDLNMYMTGKYNISNSLADMKLYGSLSKNITTVFGKIKNASLNTLFNTIPGVNDSTEKLLLQTEISKIPNIKNVTDIYRIFTVDINGDINGTDYVRSFRWVK